VLISQIRAVFSEAKKIARLATMAIKKPTPNPKKKTSEVELVVCLALYFLSVVLIFRFNSSSCLLVASVSE
jgi:hypothetical protein